MASPRTSLLVPLFGLVGVIVAVTPPQSTSLNHFLELAIPQGSGFSPAPHFHQPESREVDDLDDAYFDDAAKSNQELRMGKRRYNSRDDFDDYMTRLEQDEDPLNPKCAPPNPQDRAKMNGERGFVMTAEELNKTRSQFMYWFFDKCGDANPGDRQKDIHISNGQIHKNLNFQLPFFGFRFNYTRVSMNGYLEFSDPPSTFTYPLVFPTKDWPNENDPSFIGMFYSKCRIGKTRPSDIDKREPGVYFRMERDLHGAKDRFGVMIRERLMWDIRTGIVGAETFIPKHAVIVTWKNMSFAGGIDSSLYVTNTFQLVLATDEVITYAIFNYLDMQWTTHTEASGDTTKGEGGTPAFVGFNAGNGTRSYEYKPYSQFSTIRDLTNRGWVNGFPGRHIFRIDENIMLGNCNKDLAGANLDLVFAPESGNMLGGTVVNITGPCFLPDEKILCRFDDVTVVGTRIDSNRAICVQPYLMAEGYVRFEVSIGNNQFNYKGKYFVETPATANERISFHSDAVHKVDDSEIKITWVPYNLTANTAASVRIALYGYREVTIHPELLYIDTIEEGVPNTGSYIISPSNFRNRNNYNVTDLHFGFLQISLVNPAQYSGLSISPLLWSKPIPLGWYFKPQWARQFGKKWPESLCNEWLKNDRYLKSFTAEISQCPCTLEQALADKGSFMPDFECDKDINSQCFYHKTAIHCVRSGTPSKEGSGQECCYNKEKYLMMSYDQMWGSSPHRSHNLGQLPWNEANKVPTLSQWFHDLVPFYSCCLWQDEQAVGCETLRFERRPTQDCVSYQSPAIAAVFGDPHIITFDDFEYTFNGKGEFVLVHVDSQKLSLDVQGRFEQVSPNYYGDVAATHLTAVAAQSNSSTIIEVRLRPAYSQSRYRLDVFADKKRIFFDRPALKIQHFPGVTVYTPSAVLDQSEVIIMFHSGAGVEVTEHKGFVSARVFLPWAFLNLTRGLFGNWSFDMTDDFTLPDGRVVPISLNTNTFERFHKDFGIHWLLEDRYEREKGNALFLRENGRLASYYANRTFVPEYRSTPQLIIPPNRTEDIAMAEQLCGECYQCQYDYAVTLNRDLAYYTLSYYTEAKYFKSVHKNRVLSCGVLETPRFGRKSTFMFTPDTKVIFECDQGFILVGDKRRTCLPDGRWNIPEDFTQCLLQQEYSSWNVGVTMGVIAGVMFPLLILFGCIAYQVFRRRQKDKAEFKAPPPREGVVLTSHTNYEDQEMTPLQSTSQRETEVM